jgi:hypothetical protein
MEKITRFDKANLMQFREEFRKAVADLEKKTGVGISLGNISFESNRFTTKLTVAILDSGESVEQVEMRSNFERYAYLFGMTPQDYGKSVSSGGKLYTLVGIAPRSTKFPLIGKSADGRFYKLPKSVANSLLTT